MDRAPASVGGFREAVHCSSDNPVMRAGLERALALDGDRRDALRIADELEHGGGEHSLFAYEVGLIHLALGDSSRAIDCLEQAHRVRSGWIN